MHANITSLGYHWVATICSSRSGWITSTVLLVRPLQLFRIYGDWRICSGCRMDRKGRCTADRKAALQAMLRRFWMGAGSGRARGLPLRLEEPWEDWRRRRGRILGLHVVEEGRWSTHVAYKVCTWYNHVLRDHSRSWCAPLLEWRGSSWLAARRLSLGSSAFGGKLDLREGAGSPGIRFEDGVQLARQVLQYGSLQ